LYPIAYRASHGISQTEALSAGFSSRKNVRLETRETRNWEHREQRNEEEQGGGSK